MWVGVKKLGSSGKLWRNTQREWEGYLELESTMASIFSAILIFYLILDQIHGQAG